MTMIKAIARVVSLSFLFASVVEAAPRYVLRDLGGTGAQMTWVSGLSSSGVVVGNAVANGTVPGRGFVATTSGRRTLLGPAATIATTALAINASGQVVGSTLNKAARWDSGSVTLLDTPSGRQSRATAINNHGDVVGQIYSRSSASEAARWGSLGLTTLPGLAATGESVATDINDGGQIVGSAATSSAQTHAVLWQNGIAADLGTLGGSQSVATAINDSGNVVGFSTLAGETVTHGFLWDGVAMLDLASPAGNSRAWSVNNRGQVVGDFFAPSGRQHALLWEDNLATDLNSLVDNLPLGWLLATAQGINDRGQIAVIALNERLQLNAALLTPVPLPMPLVLMSSALLLLGFFARRASPSMTLPV